MSDYVRNKQVLYPVTKELLDRLNIIDIFDLDFSRGSKFRAEGFIDYGGTKDYNKYLDVLNQCLLFLLRKQYDQLYDYIEEMIIYIDLSMDEEEY